MPEIVVERSVMVPMRDGVRLATDVYRPAGGGPHPVLLERTPYDKSFAWFTAGLIVNPLVAVDHGYAVVVQDVRGRAASEGEWVPFVHEADDGHDAVEWAAAQPWSDGNVGVFGSSYLGVAAVQCVVAAPPHLRAAVAYLTGANHHEGWTYSGGAFELGFNLWWTSFLAWDTWARTGADPEVLPHLAAVATDWAAAARHTPLADLPGFDRAAPYWREWLEHPDYDAFWERSDATRRAGAVTAPVLNVVGWFDNFARGQMDLHRALRESSPAGADHRLVVGPWDHEAYLSVRMTASGAREFGPAALGGVNMMTPLVLGWFDHWLRGGDPPDLPPVRYFVMGDDRWAEAGAWPPPHTPQRWHLASGGAAASRGGDGRLQAGVPDADGTDTVRHDPADPVPTVGGRTLAPVFGPGGIHDQAPVEVRGDVLVYTSAPLAEPVTVAGPVRAEVHVAADAPRIDVVARLVDVDPAGGAATVAEGIRRTAVTPGAVTAVRVDLWDTAHTFRPGHRVRLQVAGSNFPRHDTVPAATLVVHHGPAHASAVVLPVA
jgi:putative CocE/NonD family hydrolase